MKNDNLDFKVMMRRDNFETLVRCTPKASHRLLEIIAEGYFSDFSDDAELEQWFNSVARREKRRFPTRSNVQVTINLDHVRALLKSHYKYRFEQFKKFYNTKK
jgi:hypothetical protein